MRKEIRIILGVCAMALAWRAGSLAAKTAQKTDIGATTRQALSADSSVDQALDALDARGKNLRDFSADVKLTETDAVVADSFARLGQVWFQRNGQSDARIHVLFTQKQVEENPPFDQKLEYLLEKGWLTDRNYHKKIEVRRQVVRPGQKINLLKLGEGPFPLPIGQDKAEVKKQFDVKKIAPAKADPPDTLHLQLTPIKGTQFARKFTTIDVWVDLKSHFPRRIETLDANQTMIRTTDLLNLKVNTGLTDAQFILPPIKPGDQWQQHDEPYRD